jgi:hypothetical protein
VSVAVGKTCGGCGGSVGVRPVRKFASVDADHTTTHVERNGWISNA